MTVFILNCRYLEYKCDLVTRIHPNAKAAPSALLREGETSFEE
jgi:hypothetical protein